MRFENFQLYSNYSIKSHPYMGGYHKLRNPNLHSRRLNLHRYITKSLAFVPERLRSLSPPYSSTHIPTHRRPERLFPPQNLPQRNHLLPAHHATPVPSCHTAHPTAQSIPATSTIFPIYPAAPPPLNPVPNQAPNGCTCPLRRSLTAAFVPCRCMGEER